MVIVSSCGIKKSAFTYNFSWINYLSINIQFLFKGVWYWGNYYNLITVAWCVFSINITKISFIYDQVNVSNINIKCFYIDVLIPNIICSIINKIHSNRFIVKSSNWIVLSIENSCISCPITRIFSFRVPGKR